MEDGCLCVLVYLAPVCLRILHCSNGRSSVRSAAARLAGQTLSHFAIRIKSAYQVPYREACSEVR
jgi:hypothetical protein